jgi:hypothetical protein
VVGGEVVVGRRVLVVALAVVVVSGSVVVVVLAGTIEVTIEVTVTVVGGCCWAPAPPATAPTTNPMTPQISPATQARRHHGSWLGGLGGRGGLGGGGVPQPAGGPCGGGCPQPPPLGGIGWVGSVPDIAAPRTGEGGVREQRLHDGNKRVKSRKLRAYA